MAQEAKVALKTEKLDAAADRGYFNGEEILACGRASARTSVRPIDVLNALSGFLLIRRSAVAAGPIQQVT
jgi:hypothetical protein